MSNTEQISELELAEAISRVAKRLMDIGWIERGAVSQGKLHFGYTKHGLERMETLKEIILGEIDSALKYPEYLALHSLLLTLDHRLPMLPSTPES
jgi:hypothetical protein